MNMKFSGNLAVSNSWLQDFSSRDVLLPGGITLDPAQFLGVGVVKVEVKANAAQNATSVSLEVSVHPSVIRAGSVLIPSGTILDLGTGKSVQLGQNILSLGTATVSVEALPTALENGDVGYYTLPAYAGKKVVLAGTLVGKQDSETLFGPAETSDQEIYLVYRDTDVLADPTTEAVRSGMINLARLPVYVDQPAMTSAMKAALRTKNFTVVVKP